MDELSDRNERVCAKTARSRSHGAHSSESARRPAAGPRFVFKATAAKDTGPVQSYRYRRSRRAILSLTLFLRRSRKTFPQNNAEYRTFVLVRTRPYNICPFAGSIDGSEFYLRTESRTPLPPKITPVWSRPEFPRKRCAVV